MSFKTKLEDNVVLVILGTALAGFVAGWGAYSAIQKASGMTSVSVSELKELQEELDLGCVEIEESLKSAERRVAYLEKRADRMGEAMLRNTASGEHSITNVRFKSGVHATDTGRDFDTICATFDYDVGEAAKFRFRFGVHPEPKEFTYTPSGLHSGKGTAIRCVWFLEGSEFDSLIINVTDVALDYTENAVMAFTDKDMDRDFRFSALESKPE